MREKYYLRYNASSPCAALDGSKQRAIDNSNKVHFHRINKADYLGPSNHSIQGNAYYETKSDQHHVLARDLKACLQPSKKDHTHASTERDEETYAYDASEQTCERLRKNSMCACVGAGVELVIVWIFVRSLLVSA